MDDNTELNPVQRALSEAMRTAFLYVYGIVVHPVQTAAILKESVDEQVQRFEGWAEQRKYWRALRRKKERG